MKIHIIIFIALVFGFSSCLDKEYEFPNDCRGYSAGLYKHGSSFAEGSYSDFGGYAIFIRERLVDTINGGWKHDEIEKSILLTTINEKCSEKVQIHIRNIKLVKSDTIWLNYSYLGLSEDYSTANLNYMDADAGIEGYHLFENDKISNWLLIESIDSDTTEIIGKFELSFITSYEPYLNGEKERWDDPNRPDTLHFTNGKFRAEFADF